MFAKKIDLEILEIDLVTMILNSLRKCKMPCKNSLNFYKANKTCNVIPIRCQFLFSMGPHFFWSNYNLPSNHWNKTLIGSLRVFVPLALNSHPSVQNYTIKRNIVCWGGEKFNIVAIPWLYKGSIFNVTPKWLYNWCNILCI